MNVVFFSTIFIFLKLCHMKSLEEVEEFPKIQELFDLPEFDGRKSSHSPPDLDGLGVTININKIDVDRLRKKLANLPRSEDAREYRAYFNMTKTLFNTATNGTLPFDTNFDDTVTLNDTRRQKIPYYSRWYNYYGTQVNSRVKMMDMALQTIYMARHKIMMLEKDKHFNRKDTGYRIAFIYKHIRKMYRRLVDIYMTSKKNLEKGMGGVWGNHDHIAYMHSRSLKIHVDFLYYYWVMIEIDKRYREKYDIKSSPVPDLDAVVTIDPFVNYRHRLEEWRVFPKKD